MEAHQAPPSLGFSRQEHWNGLPFPSPMHESEKWKWSRSTVSDSQRPHGLQPTRLLRAWDFPGKSSGGGAIAFSNQKRLKLKIQLLSHIIPCLYCSIATCGCWLPDLPESMESIPVILGRRAPCVFFNVWMLSIMKPRHHKEQGKFSLFLGSHGSLANWLRPSRLS